VLGIMFMTTNQVKEIDIAFESRITVMIPYPQLGREQLRVVLRSLIDLAEQNIKGLKVEENFYDTMYHYLEDKKATWINGRVLKSLVKSAISLASSESEKRGLEHIILSWKVFLPLLNQAEEANNHLREQITMFRQMNQLARS